MGFMVTVLFEGPIFQNGTFYIVQLQIIHLLNLQCNVLLKFCPVAIAESIVRIVTCNKIMNQRSLRILLYRTACML